MANHEATQYRMLDGRMYRRRVENDQVIIERNVIKDEILNIWVELDDDDPIKEKLLKQFL